MMSALQKYKFLFLLQMEFLQQYGCDLIQGYLIGKPVDADTAAKEYV